MGAPGLAGFETWDWYRHHKCGVRSITARHNPKRGLVEAPELRRWSRFRAYAYQ